MHVKIIIHMDNIGMLRVDSDAEESQTVLDLFFTKSKEARHLVLTEDDIRSELAKLVALHSVSSSHSSSEFLKPRTATSARCK